MMFSKIIKAFTVTVFASTVNSAPILKNTENTEVAIFTELINELGYQAPDFSKFISDDTNEVSAMAIVPGNPDYHSPEWPQRPRELFTQLLTLPHDIQSQYTLPDDNEITTAARPDVLTSYLKKKIEHFNKVYFQYISAYQKFQHKLEQYGLRTNPDAPPKPIHTIDKWFDGFMKSTYKDVFPHPTRPVKRVLYAGPVYAKKAGITAGHIVGNFTRLSYHVLPGTIIEPLVIMSSSAILGGAIGSAVGVPAGFTFGIAEGLRTGHRRGGYVTPIVAAIGMSSGTTGGLVGGYYGAAAAFERSKPTGITPEYYNVLFWRLVSIGDKVIETTLKAGEKVKKVESKVGNTLGQKVTVPAKEKLINPAKDKLINSTKEKLIKPTKEKLVEQAKEKLTKQVMKSTTLKIIMGEASANDLKKDKPVKEIKEEPTRRIKQIKKNKPITPKETTEPMTPSVVDSINKDMEDYYSSVIENQIGDDYWGMTASFSVSASTFNSGKIIEASFNDISVSSKVVSWTSPASLNSKNYFSSVTYAVPTVIESSLNEIVSTKYWKLVVKTISSGNLATLYLKHESHSHETPVILSLATSHDVEPVELIPIDEHKITESQEVIDITETDSNSNTGHNNKKWSLTWGFKENLRAEQELISQIPLLKQISKEFESRVKPSQSFGDKIRNYFSN